MTEMVDIARAARQLRGTPEEIAADLVVQIEAAPHFPADDASLSDCAAYRKAVGAHWLAVSARRHWLTMEFARRHGWTFKRSDHFTQPMLADGRKRQGRRDEAWAGCGWADHSHYFRTPDGYPVAVVAHPYEGSFGPGYQTTAEVNGLVISYPTDFPNWWYPGRTTLVLFQTAASA